MSCCGEYSDLRDCSCLTTWVTSQEGMGFFAGVGLLSVITLLALGILSSYNVVQLTDTMRHSFVVAGAAGTLIALGILISRFCCPDPKPSPKRS
jgi:hypothetical protein